MNILIGILLGYLIFTLANIIVGKTDGENDIQKNNLKEKPRFNKAFLTLNTRTGAFRRKIKSTNANRRNGQIL